jgi:sulfate permease, SulP family
MSSPSALPAERRALAPEVTGGTLSTLSSLPQTVPFGILVFAPFGPEAIPAGVLSSLISAIVGTFVVTAIGPLRTQIAGPRSATSLVLVSLSSWLAGQGTGLDLGLTLLMICVVLAGTLQLILGKARLAGFVRIVPYPVLVGFTAGLALTLVWSQIPVILGYPPERAVLSLRPWQDGSPAALAIVVGTLAIHALITLRKPAWPALAVAFLAGLALTLIVALIAGNPASPALSFVLPGLPVPLPTADMLGRIAAFLADPARAGTLLLFVALIALISTVETLLSVISIDSLLETFTDPNQELVAQGVSNILCGLLGGMTSAGSMARTLVNHQAGARTRLSVLVHGLQMAALMVVSEPLKLLPMPVLAAIMLIVAHGMIDPWLIRLLRHAASERDLRAKSLPSLFVVAVTLLVTVFINPLGGVLCGTAMAGALFLRALSRPVLRAVQDATGSASRRMRPAAEVEALNGLRRQILIARIEGPVFFGTANQLRAWSRAPDADPLSPSRVVIIDLGEAGEIDVTGSLVINQMRARLAAGGRAVGFTGLSPPDARQKTLLEFDPGRQLRFFPDLDRALEWAEDEVLKSAGLALAPNSSGTRSSLADGLAPDIGRAILERFAVQRVPAGAIIFREGEAGEALFVLEEGLVRLEIGEGDHSVRLRTIAPGVVFGEMALLDSRPRSATAIAETDCVVRSLSQAEFEAFTAEFPMLAGRLMQNLARELAQRLRATNAILLTRDDRA